MDEEELVDDGTLFFPLTPRSPLPPRLPITIGASAQKQHTIQMSRYERLVAQRLDDTHIIMADYTTLMGCCLTNCFVTIPADAHHIVCQHNILRDGAP